MAVAPSVLPFPAPDPWESLNIDDLFNEQTRATAMARIWKGKAYFRPDSKTWIIWSDEEGRWLDEVEPDNAGLWDLACQEFLAKCVEVGERQQRTSSLRFGPDSLLTHKAWSSLSKLTRHQREFQLRGKQFNSRSRYIGVRNGVLDLNTGALMKPDPSLLVSISLDVDYDPQAHSRVWDRVLLDITGDDRDYRLFLREHFGAMLGGRNDWERFTILQGPGGSGKSTFGNTIRNVLGPYALSANHDTFSRQRAGSIREDLAAFTGKRYIVDMELPDGHRLDPSIIKMLSGRDIIRARKLYQGGSEIKPTWSIVVACNLLPTLDPAPDSGFWRRVLVLPFRRRPRRVDRHLKDKLATQQARTAVLAWLVAGYRAYASRPPHAPVRLPHIVQTACAEYRMRYDHLSYWLEICTIPKPDAQSSNHALYSSYLEFCDHYSIEEKLTPEHLSRYLNNQGYAPYRTKIDRGRKGILVKDEMTNPADMMQDDEYEYPVNLSDFCI